MAKDMTSNLMTIGLLGAGGYLLYTYGQQAGWFGEAAGAVPANGGTQYNGGPVQTGGNATQGPQAGSQSSASTPTQNNQASLAGVKQRLQAVAGNGPYNPWEWAYFIEISLGIIPSGYLDPYVIDPQIAGYSVEQVENTGYSLNEWWSLAAPVIAQHAGLSGLGGRGMGGMVTTGEMAAAASGYYGIPGLAGPGRSRFAGGSTHNNANYAGATGMPSYGIGTLERARKIETEIIPIS